MSNDQEKEDLKELKWPSGLFLAMASLCGYIYAYAYQKGFLQYYGLDESFIGLPVEVILRNIVYVGIALVALICGINVILKIFPIVRNSFFKDAMIYTLMCLFILLFDFIIVYSLDENMHWDALILIGGGLAVYWTINIVLFFRKSKGIKGLSNRFERVNKEKEKTQESNGKIRLWKDTILGKWIDRIFGILILVVIIYSYGFSVGGNSAAKKDQYMLIRDTNNIVISNYNNTFIVIPVDIQKKTFSKNYSMISLENVEFEIMKIGPIVPEKNTN